ncbi:MAG: TetR family transcriptional regulator [Myxococcales bacterium]|nr:TetR family transcriptional regulator [Myxococcales bacterium]
MPPSGMCYLVALIASKYWKGDRKLGESPPSLRERKKTETRAAILREARALFTVQGFDGATLDDICAKVSVSRRTFFRYFPSKEALVFPNREARLAEFAGFLEARPQGEDTYSTLRKGTTMFAASYSGKRLQLLELQSLIAGSSTLQNCEREIDREWEEVIRAAFVIEFGDDEAGCLRARILAGATIGVVRATMRHWYQGDGRDNLAQLGLDALDALQRGFPLPATS